MWRDIKLILWLMALLKEKGLALKRLSLQFLQKTLLRQSWHQLPTLILSFIIWMSKATFLNGNIDETIYMVQPENFVSRDLKQMACKLKKFIYRLKQNSHQWFCKFHQVVIFFGFEMNVIDNYIYHKFSRIKHIFLVLYVSDILLANKDIGFFT